MRLPAVLVCGEGDGHVARPLADSRGSPQRARTVALERRALVDHSLAHHQLVGDQLVVVLRVGDCGVQELQDIPRGRARRAGEYGTGLSDRLAADVLDYEPRLAGRGADVLRARPDGDGALGGARRGRGGLAAPRGD